MWLEDEQSVFSLPMSYDSMVFFNEAPFILELHLHALFYYLADQDRIFRDGWDVQDVLEVDLFAIVPKWDISHMPN